MQFRVTIHKNGAADEVRIMEGASRFAIYDEVRREGGLVTGIREGGKTALESFNLNLTSGVHHDELITFVRNLSTMVAAGLSVPRALAIVERQSHNKFFKKVISDVSRSITTGETLHASFALHPKVFPPLMVAMVRAGEEAGSLSNALSVIATQMEKSRVLTKKIQGAMIYPAVILTAMTVIGTLMMMYVVPTLTATFKEFNTPLPLSTKVIIFISNFIVSYILELIIAVIALIIGVIWYLRTPAGQNLLVRIALKLPIIGEMVRETYAARVSRTLASLVSAGIDLVKALEVTTEVVHVPVFAQVITEGATLVKKGNTISSAFVAHPDLYPVMMSDMLAVGEETGKMAEMLEHVATYYEDRVEQQTKDMSSLIEPILMLIIGVFVGIFAVSMIAPIYSIGISS